MRKLLLIFLCASAHATETVFIQDRGFESIWLWQLSNTTSIPEKGISLSSQSTNLFDTPELLWTGSMIGGNIYLGTAETASIFLLDSSYKSETIFSSSNHAIISSIKQDGSGIIFAASPDPKLYVLDSSHKETTNISFSNTFIWDIVPSPQGGWDILTGLKAEVYEYKNGTLSDPIEIQNEEHILAGLYIGDTLWVLGEKALYQKTNGKFTALAAFEGSASDFIYTNGSFYVLHTVTVKANPAAKQEEQVTSKLSKVEPATGLVEELYSMPRFYLNSIAFFDNQIIMGADQYGLYVFYDLTDKNSHFSSLGTGKIVDILHKGSELILVTADKSALWALQDSAASAGSFISKVYDAGASAKWGEFQAKITAPQHTAVKFFIQSGVTLDPEYWSDWIEITNKQMLPSTPHRYMRYKAELSSTSPDAVPYVHSIAFPYTQYNLPPSFNGSTVEQKNGDMVISWNASDPNSDKLEYTVFLAQDGMPSIQITENPITATNYAFKLASYPSGYKRIKVIASDRPSNSENTALTAELNTIPLMFDTIPPTITNFNVAKSAGKAIITFTALDTDSVINSASYIIDGTREYRLAPIDGIFDSQEEQFSFTVDLNKALFLQIKITDKAENTALHGETILPPN